MCHGRKLRINQNFNVLYFDPSRIGMLCCLAIPFPGKLAVSHTLIATLCLPDPEQLRIHNLTATRVTPGLRLFFQQFIENEYGNKKILPFSGDRILRPS